MATFANFNRTGTPAAGDFIVGYNAAGTAEQRTTVNDLLSTGLALYNSDKWNSNYTTTNTNSASWSSAYTTLNAASAVTIVDGGNTRSANIAIGARDAYNVALRTNNANRVWILSSGEVGIGPSLTTLVNLINSTSPDSPRLTVGGTISATGNLFSTGFATFVKNASYPTLSSTLLNNADYYNSKGTFVSPGGFIIKGQSPDYSTSIQNLPGWGVYGLQIQNVDNMDPGTTFINDGRGNSTHAFSFRAGNANFTAGADHNHVQWQGAPSNNTQAWQMTNGGSTSVYGFGANTYSQRFLVHTLPQYQISTTITAVSGYIDTLIANLGTDSDRLTGVRLIVDTAAGANNYNIINVGEVVGFTLNPGLVGLAAAAYETQCTQVSSNPTGTLSAFQFDFFIGNGSNWTPASRGIQVVDLKSRANGGNPGVNQITSQIGNPSTQYVGLTGSYRGMNKHCLARFTTNSILTGFKPGSPLTLWIPKSMPSSSPIGSGFITSDKIATFALGTFPSGVRSGYFDAYVINVSGGDMEFALCNLMDSYGFENRSWPISATGTAGWLLYGGTQDTVHRPTFGTAGFYFEREPWYFDGTNFLSGGMVKCVSLGNSEVYGNFSYGLGFRGAVLGQKSGTFAGDYNAVLGDNSVALGGSNLVSISSNQVVVGTFNDPNTNALFVVGSGTADTNRNNAFEVYGNGDVRAAGIPIESYAAYEATNTVNNAACPVIRVANAYLYGTTFARLPKARTGYKISFYPLGAKTLSAFPGDQIIPDLSTGVPANSASFTGGTTRELLCIDNSTWVTWR